VLLVVTSFGSLVQPRSQPEKRFNSFIKDEFHCNYRSRVIYILAVFLFDVGYALGCAMCGVVDLSLNACIIGRAGAGLGGSSNSVFPLNCNIVTSLCV